MNTRPCHFQRSFKNTFQNQIRKEFCCQWYQDEIRRIKNQESCTDFLFCLLQPQASSCRRRIFLLNFTSWILYPLYSIYRCMFRNDNHIILYTLLDMQGSTGLFQRSQSCSDFQRRPHKNQKDHHSDS